MHPEIAQCCFRAGMSFWLRVYRLCPSWVLRRLMLRGIGCDVAKDSAIHPPEMVTGRGRLRVGPGSTVNYGCYLDTREWIVIGKGVMAGHKCRIYTAGHDVDDPGFQCVRRPVTIDDGVTIFPNSIIMPGVHIGLGAVIFPGSVVTRPVGDYEIAGGNPARPIRIRKTRTLHMHSYYDRFPIA